MKKILIILAFLFLPNLVDAALLIDKVEYGTIAIGADTSVNTATLGSSFDTSRSSVFWLGSSFSNHPANASTTMAALDFTNSTTITATRGTQSAQAASTLTVGFVVVQWSSGVTTSIQRGTIVTNGGSTSNTATISSVDTSRSFVHWLGDYATSSISADLASAAFRQTLTDSTTVTATRQASVGTATTSYEVIQFASGVLNSAPQAVSIGLNGSANPMVADATISSVNTNNAIIFYGGVSSNNGSVDNHHAQINLENATTVRGRRTNANVQTTINGTVLEFNSSYLASNVQSGSLALTGVGSNTATISSVNASVSLLSFGGLFSSTSSNNTRAKMRITLTNGTTITGTKVTATSNASTTFMVLESSTVADTPPSFQSSGKTRVNILKRLVLKYRMIIK